MDSNTVVPDSGGNIDTVIQMPVLFVLVQLELVRFDDGTHLYSLLHEFLIFDVFFVAGTSHEQCIAMSHLIQEKAAYIPIPKGWGFTPLRDKGHRRKSRDTPKYRLHHFFAQRHLK